MSRFVDIEPNEHSPPQSATAVAAQKVIALRQAGVHVVSFALGEPDQETPEHIRAAAVAAIQTSGMTSHYTEIAGRRALRRVIAASIVRDHGIECDDTQVIVSTGAKHVLYNALHVLLRAGDEVIIPSPHWTSYPDIVRLAGGVPVLLPTSIEQGFVPDPDALARACTPRTRAIILCSPNNPTGAVYPEQVTRAIAQVAARIGAVMICDVIYRALSFGAPSPSLARVAADSGAAVIVVDGVSKAYRMTGWRIGWGAGPPRIIGAMAALQGQSTANPTSVAQEAAMAALTGPQDCVAELRAEFAERRRAMLEGIASLPDVRLPVAPEGGFYALPDFRAWIGAKTPKGETIASDKDLAAYFLDAEAVGVNTGSAFGAPGFLRFTYATTVSEIEEGFRRLRRALAGLSRA